MDYAEKMQRCHEYAEALEEEKRKIQVFQRELPLCLEIVTQAIEACRRESSGTTTTTEYMHGQSERSEQISSDVPILEEFIPIKRSSSSEDEDEQQSHKNARNKEKNNDKKKSDWLRSVQLWNQSPDPLPKENVPRKTTVVEVKRYGGAFQPFHVEKSVGKTKQSVSKVNCSAPAAATSSTTENGSKADGGDGSSKKEDKEGKTQRKQRRYWSRELHRRFLHALQQLGGSHAATPKQIRELMNVDGLTNDEVKSHLQKYRLHTTRPRPLIHNAANSQAPQYVVVGRLWAPPPEYATVAEKPSGEASIMTTTNLISAPVSSTSKLRPAIP